MNSEAVNGHLELVADGFSFPTSLTFDDAGAIYIAESGLPFGGAQPGGRVWKIGQHGQRTLLAHNLRQPVNGLTFYQGSLYLSEGGIQRARGGSAASTWRDDKPLSWTICPDQAITENGPESPALSKAGMNGRSFRGGWVEGKHPSSLVRCSPWD